MTHPDRSRLKLLGALSLAAAAPGAFAQTGPFPNHPIRLVVPFPAGAGVDNLARIFATRMGESMNQQIIVDNRPGANSAIGTDFVAKSPADGYTLLMTATSHMTTPLLTPTTYDSIKDFQPIATVCSNDFVLVVNSAVPAKTLQELIAYAKANPGKLNYSSAGTGNPNHLAGELFDMQAGVKTTHVPYKGGGPAVQDLVGGQVQMHFASPDNVMQYIKNGKLRPLAVSSPTRMASLPDVPTFAEAGVKDYELRVWYGVVAPRGVPPDIVTRLRAEVRKALALQTTRDRFAVMGMDPYDTTLEQFDAVMKSDRDKFERIIKAANVKLN
jgi:tripartite-type tricarboxylate transporter receptor subunit TctC